MVDPVQPPPGADGWLQEKKKERDTSFSTCFTPAKLHTVLGEAVAQLRLRTESCNIKRLDTISKIMKTKRGTSAKSVFLCRKT